MLLRERAHTHTQAHTNTAENSTSAFPPRLSILKPHFFPFTLCLSLTLYLTLLSPSPTFSFFISFSPFLSIFAITISLTFPVSLALFLSCALSMTLSHSLPLSFSRLAANFNTKHLSCACAAPSFSLIHSSLPLALVTISPF